MSKKITLATTATIAVAAVAAQFGTTAAAANPCSGISENRPAIEEALYEKFGGSDGKVELERGAGVNFTDLVLRGKGTITLISGCTIKYEAPAQKYYTSTQPGEVGEVIRRNGTLEWMIGFDHAEGNRFCVAGNTMKEAEWSDEGRVKENRFVKRNEKKRAFFGCTFAPQSQAVPQSSDLLNNFQSGSGNGDR